MRVDLGVFFALGTERFDRNVFLLGRAPHLHVSASFTQRPQAAIALCYCKSFQTDSTIFPIHIPYPLIYFPRDVCPL
jgi:hypothetical protein